MTTPISQVIAAAVKTGQSINNGISETGSAVQTARKTPVNAVAAAVTILATEVARMNNGDRITFDGVELTKASSTDAAEGEFSNIAGIRSCVDELLGDAWATSGTTNATLTSKVKGLAYNNIVASTVIVEDTTDNGGAEAKSTATIAAATLAVLAAGDTVEFAGEVFTKVASGATGNQFTNTAGLIALIDAIDGWTAAENAGAIEIEASENGAENDGIDVIVTLRRPTAGGINGTVGLRDQIVTDAAYLYVCTANNTVNDSNWRRVALGSVY